MTTTTKNATTTPACDAGVDATDLEVAAMTTKALLDIVGGGLSRPSKMPGWSYGIPAAECRVGTRLREVEGSTCAGYTDPDTGRRVGGCYAHERGMYRFPATKNAQYRRLIALDDPRWVAAMSTLIQRKGETWFRWHDSGDLQSVDHLARIVEVARRTPNVRHWIPTREYRIVRDWIAAATPDDLATLSPNGGNLTIRMSAHMIGGHVPTFPGLPVVVSSVSPHDDPTPDARRCPAPEQGNACGDCRACWNPDHRLIDYALH